MDFTPTDERRMLADTLGRYLAAHYGFATRMRVAGSPEGFSREAWGAMAELGVIGALFGEEAGGFGGAGFDIATVFEAVGRAIVVEPFLGTLLAGRLLTRAGRHDGLVADMIAGSRIATAALYEAQSRYDYASVVTRAERDGSGWRITGAKAVVPQIEAADVLIVSARTAGCPGRPDGLSLFAVPRTARGVTVRGYGMIDGGRGGELELGDVALDGIALVGREGEALPPIERAIAAGIVALSFEAVGAMAAARDATLEHLRGRVQFGAPIGRSQALQHRMATVEIEIEQARSAAINAAAALDGARHARERTASAAKYTIGRVGTLVAEEAIQMHGAIGMTWELPLAHYAKRLVMIDHQLGDEDFHLQRYIDLGYTGPPAVTPEDLAEA
jgi:alkylation response protein AidB-like acyl-CoA dehydrogenase